MAFPFREYYKLLYEKEMIFMNKRIIRILWLIVSAVVFFPVWMLIGIWGLVFYIKCAISFNQPIRYGITAWLDRLAEGIEMNKEFINNGL